MGCPRTSHSRASRGSPPVPEADTRLRAQGRMETFIVRPRPRAEPPPPWSPPLVTVAALLRADLDRGHRRCHRPGPHGHRPHHAVRPRSGEDPRRTATHQRSPVHRGLRRAPSVTRPDRPYARPGCSGWSPMRQRRTRRRCWRGRRRGGRGRGVDGRPCRAAGKDQGTSFGGGGDGRADRRSPARHLWLALRGLRRGEAARLWCRAVHAVSRART